MGYLAGLLCIFYSALYYYFDFKYKGSITKFRFKSVFHVTQYISFAFMAVVGIFVITKNKKALKFSLMGLIGAETITSVIGLTLEKNVYFLYPNTVQLICAPIATLFILLLLTNNVSKKLWFLPSLFAIAPMLYSIYLFIRYLQSEPGTVLSPDYSYYLFLMIYFFVYLSLGYLVCKTNYFRTESSGSSESETDDKTVDELKHYHSLLKDGVITEDEFNDVKRRLLH